MRVTKIDGDIAIVLEDPIDLYDLEIGLTYRNDLAMWHSCNMCSASVPVGAKDHKEDCIVRELKEYFDGRGA